MDFDSDFFQDSPFFPMNSSVSSVLPSIIVDNPATSDLQVMCPTHKSNYTDCESCCDKLTSGFLNRKRSEKLMKTLSEELESTEKIKAELQFLKQELSNLCSVNKVPPAFAAGDLQQELYAKPLPKSLFSICETAEGALSYMMKLQIFPSNPPCKKCDNTMKLQGRGGLGFAYTCMKCENRIDYKAGTFWERVSFEPNQILWYMILWVVKARDIEISHLMELSLAFVSMLSKKVRKVISNEYLSNLPVFKGIVEIDIKNFVKRKIEIGKSKAKERWVLIMVERARKFTYMEALAERSFNQILEIVQKRCEIGTIIITENWKVYGRLEDYGYPHYKLDLSKGFAHMVNPKINISNTYGQWAWMKHAIKRYNRISSDLGDHLNEFQWRRKMKHSHKGCRILEGMLKIALAVISRGKFEDKNRKNCFTID